MGGLSIGLFITVCVRHFKKKWRHISLIRRICPFHGENRNWYEAAMLLQIINVCLECIVSKMLPQPWIYLSHLWLIYVHFGVGHWHSFSCVFVALRIWSKPWHLTEWRVFTDSNALFTFSIAHFNFLKKTNQIKKAFLHHLRSNNAVWPKQGQITLRSNFSIWLIRHFPFIWHIPFIT